MVSRKRAREETAAGDTTPATPAPEKENSLLVRLRNTWEFANLMQWIFIFGKAVKIDEDFDIEDLESECLKPGGSEKLAEIGLALLKFVSSHRGLTPDLFDEYTRRQYVAKAPARNPYGIEEKPKKFAEFDVFHKLRVLHQLSVWTLFNPDRLRERMVGHTEGDQTEWRIEELGYDRQERLYFVLDDNRLYRRTDPPLTPPKSAKPKANSVKARAAARARKRRRVSLAESSDVQEGEEENGDKQEEEEEEEGEDTFGGMKWECLAITLEEYQDFLDSIAKSKDTNERELRDRITEQVMPVIGKAAEDQRKKQARTEKELLDFQKLASAKRSGRLAEKHERERQEQETLELKRKHEADLAQAIQDQARKEKMELDRQSRMMTREQRIKDRDQKRLLHEREVQLMAEREQELENGESRISERHLKAELEKKKKRLEELAEEAEWTFDCSGCGLYGKNADDGSHSIACEKCSVWQHSKCLGFSPAEAEKDDFHFVCQDCKRKEEEEKIKKIKRINLRLNPSSSPPDKNVVNGHSPRHRKRMSQDDINQSPTTKRFQHVEIPPANPNFFSPPQQPALPNGTPTPGGLAQPPTHNMNNFMGGPRLSPQGHQPPPVGHPYPYQNGGYGHSPTKPPSSPYQHPSLHTNGDMTPYPPHVGSPGMTRPPFSPPAYQNGPPPQPHQRLAYTPNLPPRGYQNISPRPPSQGANGYGPGALPPAPASSASARTLPSPIGQNTPSMSPSQGHGSPTLGRSPTKQSPPPSVPNAHFPPRANNPNNAPMHPHRNISNTPVLPPITNLAPSPKVPLPPFQSGMDAAATPPKPNLAPFPNVGENVNRNASEGY